MPPKRDSQINFNNSSSGANHQQHNHQHQQQQQHHDNRQDDCNNSIGATLRVRAVTGNTSGVNGALSSSINANHDNSIDWANEQRQQQYLANAKLCRLVKKCPWMYDRHHENYAKKSILDKSWAKIARECDESVASCKERWRNIRAAFARSINIYKTHGGPNRVKPYYLHAELDFLVKPMMEGRDKQKYDDDIENGRELDETANESEADVESNELADSKELSEQDDTSASTIEEKDKLTEEQNNYEPELAIDSDDENEIIFNHDNSRQKNQNGKPTEALHNGTNTATTATITVPQMPQYHTEPKRQKCYHYSIFGNDPDAKFLEALLPDLRAMNHRQKISFKRKIYQSIEEVLEMNSDVSMLTVGTSTTPTLPHYASNYTTMNVERTHMLNRVFNMSDDEVLRLNAYLQKQQQQQQNISSPHMMPPAQVTNGHTPQPLTIIPRGIPRKKRVTTSSPPTNNTKVPRPEAPWDQVVPIVVKEELEDVDIE